MKSPRESGGDGKPNGRPRIVGIAGRRTTLMADPSDTAAACHERADADLRKSQTDLPTNARLLLEASAKHWRARAKQLERAEKASAARVTGTP
jgi:hypothetical protein